MKKNPFSRSPTLETVLMVEKTIEKHSGECNKTEIWKKLPKKVMWQTYLVIIDYLESVNKIGIDRQGKIAYLWNPKLASMIRKRKEIKL
ncbi:MAG: hypothetical protein V1645_04845 [archaeon]